MLEIESTQRQLRFFEHISKKYYKLKPSALVKDIQAHLFLGRQAAYRRINGETLLDQIEITLLIAAYEVPINILFPDAKITPPSIYKNNNILKAVTQHYVV
jgi:ABC-type sulfate transport system permease subunit